jgi:hypothetical protein
MGWIGSKYLICTYGLISINPVVKLKKNKLSQRKTAEAPGRVSWPGFVDCRMELCLVVWPLEVEGLEKCL